MTAAPGVDVLGHWRPASTNDLQAAWLLARREFGEEFPGVVVWFGLTSRKWRAMVPAAGGWRLLESPEPDDLRTQIRGAQGFWPVHGGQRHGGDPGATLTRTAGPATARGTQAGAAALLPHPAPAHTRAADPGTTEPAGGRPCSRA